MNIFIETLTSTESALRNRSFFELCKGKPVEELLLSFDEIERFRKETNNLYEKVRASIFLYAGYRFVLNEDMNITQTGNIPVDGYKNLLNRNFEKAIYTFRDAVIKKGSNLNVFSALAECYHNLTFQILADQVRKSVRANTGNRWMFRVGHSDEHPLRINSLLLKTNGNNILFPILQEKTSVRLDLTHSCWSDIFFLGMDYPEGAQVINISVDLGVYEKDEEIKPPIETYLRVINEPVLRLTSIDLNDTKDITELSDLFNFANDYLGLLKAGVIASGLIPPSFEGTNFTIAQILSKIIMPGMGLEIVTKVNDIPKGSRLAVSTNLLASIISLIMRATGQVHLLEGNLNEKERRMIASRAILGEWLGGSGGGWQDSGGVWPGIKSIKGVVASPVDPEFNISRGCLLPVHRLLVKGIDVHKDFEEKLSSSLVLFHGGMASNVGPVLEMVTEKYLLRSKAEWDARQKSNSFFNRILETIKEGDIKKLAFLTSQNFEESIKTIIPAATNAFTEKVIEKVKYCFGENYWGFLMLGGISGGGMGMFFNPEIQPEAKTKLLEILKQTKKEMVASLPFAMDPVVYNFAINELGSSSNLLAEDNALMPKKYYSMVIPMLAQKGKKEIADVRKIEFDLIACQNSSFIEMQNMLCSIIGNMFKYSNNTEIASKLSQNSETEIIKKENGFDLLQHEQIRQDLIKGRIGLARNRLPIETIIEDVDDSEIEFYESLIKRDVKSFYKEPKVAVMCLAAGVGSRWTKGAGVIKAISPFVEFKSKHRSFVEIHIAKIKKCSKELNVKIPMIISTSYLTDEPIREQLTSEKGMFRENPIYFSPGRSIGQRFIPMERDLRFMWEESFQEKLDENKQKVRESYRQALISWANSKGGGNDYVENTSSQRLHPIGHWYEFSNMFRNGVLKKVLTDFPTIENIMLHNVDTLGATVSPEIMDFHIKNGNTLTFEIIPRRVYDKGGGLAKINGKIRILEGLAQPHDEDELSLSFYNSMTTWINIDKYIEIFGLTRENIFELSDEKINDAIRNIARKLPTYITIKDVKYRWGNGQEDVYPVVQFEKLWSDMSSYPGVRCGYVVVPRKRGQQLKDPEQLDGWINDFSADYVESLCEFN